MAAAPLNDVRQRLYDAYQKGDEAALAAAVRDYKQGRAALKRSLSNVKSDAEHYNPTEGMGTVERLAVGNTAGFANVGRHAQLLASKAGDALSGNERQLSSLIGAGGGPGETGSARTRALRRSIAEAESLEKPLMDTGAGATGRFIGELAATAPITGAAGSGARALTGLLPGAKAAVAAGTKLPKLARYLPWAAEGASGSELVSEDSAGSGAALGAGFGRLGQAAGTLVRGLRGTPSTKAALELGADLTPGQMAPDTILGRIERTASASPILGGAIVRAREAALNDVVPNLSADIAGIGRKAGEGLQGSARRLAARKAELYNPASAVKTTPMTKGDIRSFATTANRALNASPAVDRKVLARELADVLGRVKDAKTAGQIKEVLSELKRSSRQLNYKRGGASPTERRTADVYDRAAEWVDNYHQKVVKDPSLIENVKIGDRITARAKPIERASAAAQERSAAVPRGRELMGAVRKSMAEGEFTRGTGDEVRQTAEAMTDIQKSRGGGILERIPSLRAALGAASIPIAAGAMFKGTRRLAQGSTAPQRLVQALSRREQHTVNRLLTKALGRSKANRLLRQRSAGFRPSLAAASQPDREDE